MSQWISVDDELPTRGKDVLVLLKDGTITLRYYVPSDGIHCWGWYPGGQAIENSTHWLPLDALPAPPHHD